MRAGGAFATAKRRGGLYRWWPKGGPRATTERVEQPTIFAVSLHRRCPTFLQKKVDFQKSVGYLSFVFNKVSSAVSKPGDASSRSQEGRERTPPPLFTMPAKANPSKIGCAFYVAKWSIKSRSANASSVKKVTFMANCEALSVIDCLLSTVYFESGGRRIIRTV